MDGRGRPRKPQDQKKREGTYRADRDNALQVPTAVPDSPPYLSDAAKAHWKRISSLLIMQDLLSSLDGDALAMLCLALTEYEQAERDIAENGLTGTTDKGYEYLLPAVGIRTNAWKKIVILCRQFGMTPGARASLKVIPRGDEDDDPIDQAFKIMQEDDDEEDVGAA